MGPHVDTTNSGAQVKITALQFMPISFQPSGPSHLLASYLGDWKAGMPEG